MHIRWPCKGVLCLILAGVVLSAGCMTSAPGPLDQTGSSRITPADLETRVIDAAGFARVAGCEAAIAGQGGVSGLSPAGNVPLFAAIFNGTHLASSPVPGHEGEEWLNSTDIRGLQVLAMAQGTARSGGGFIASLSPAPYGRCMDDAAIDGYVPTIGYVYPVDTTRWLGGGMYMSDLAGADMEPGPVKAMTTLVRQGAEYGKKYGRERAFVEISNQSGMFVDADRHYLYAYDYNGTLLAHPYLQDRIGTSLINRTDPFGMRNIRALCDTAKGGGGYIVFVWPNPDAGNRQETKIGFVMLVDDTWWVGSGVYLGEVTGKPAYYPDSVG